MSGSSAGHPEQLRLAGHLTARVLPVRHGDLRAVGCSHDRSSPCTGSPAQSSHDPPQMSSTATWLHPVSEGRSWGCPRKEPHGVLRHQESMVPGAAVRQSPSHPSINLGVCASQPSSATPCPSDWRGSHQGPSQRPAPPHPAARWACPPCTGDPGAHPAFNQDKSQSSHSAARQRRGHGEPGASGKKRRPLHQASFSLIGGKVTFS